MDVNYETLKQFDDRIAQLEGILSQLIEELKAAKIIKSPKQ